MQALGSGLKKQNWDASSLSRFEKNFYVENPAVAARSEREIHEYRKLHQMQIFGPDVPKPITGFLEAGFPDCKLRTMFLASTVLMRHPS